MKVVSSSISEEVGRFVVDRVEKLLLESVSRGSGGWVVSTVVLGVVDWVVGTPFDDEAALLDEWLVVFDR